jgi:hypothetical protein
MIREILSVLFVVILYKQLMNEKVLIINPTVKMIKNVTYYDSENIYKLKKLE